MQKNSNRSGWALAAVVSLVASMFGALPSQANAVLGDVAVATDGAAFGVYANNVAAGAASSSEFVGTLTDDFPVFIKSKTSTQLTGNMTVAVERLTGHNMSVVWTHSATANISGLTNSAVASASWRALAAGTVSATTSVAAVASDVVNVNFKVTTDSALASWSPVTLRITAWYDTVRADGLVSRDEQYVTQTVTFLHPSALSRDIVISPVTSGSATLTASATVTGVNLANLRGSFGLIGFLRGGTEFNYVSTKTAAAMATDRGVISGSAAVSGLTPSAILRGSTVSAILRYASTNVGATASFTVPTSTATALEAVAVVGDNALTTSATAADIRANSTYTVEFKALSGSATVSGLAIAVSMSGPALTLPGSSISIADGAATASYPSAFALTTGTDGTAKFTFSTTGVAAGQSFVLTATSAELSVQYTLTTRAAAFKVVNDMLQNTYATAPGQAVTLNYNVEDQWGVASTRTNQRIQVTQAGTGFAFTTVSFVAVAAGKATFTFLPAPATRTGSPTVATVLQSLDADTNVWSNVGSSAGGLITINVTDKANAFTASGLVSVSASISYAAASGRYSWSPAVSLKVENAGSAVTVSVPNAIIEYNSKTYSGTVVARADGTGNLSLKFASTKAGTHVVTYTNGTSVTTSQFVVTAAQEKDASSITLADASIVAGQTSTVTGVLSDKLGNPVESSKLIVRWTGKGLPFNIGSAVVTDEKGQFSFQVLALPGETGTGVATATFKPTALAADDITVSKTYTIAAPAVVAGPEINAVIGSFNGRWAVRVENAKGAVVSVKVGNRWVKYTSLNDNYLFSRKSRVGATVPVAVYVNGQLENVATITIK